MENIDISVIIPVHNGEKYIEDCLLSFLKQETKLNYEIIVVLDACSDKTEQLVNAIGANYSNIITKKVSNYSALLTRRDGIEEAKGKFIMFMDADDIAYKNSLDLMYDSINENDDIDLVNGSFMVQKNFKFSNGIRVNKIYKDRYESINALFKDISFRGFLNTKIFRSHILKAIDFSSLPEGKYMYEDRIINFLYLLRSRKTKCIKDIVCVYNKDNVRSITNSIKTRIDDNLLVHDYLKNYIVSMKDPKLIKVFRKHYFRTYLNLMVDIKYSKFESKKSKRAKTKMAKFALKHIFKD